LILQVCVNRCLQRGAAGSGRSDDNLESLKKRFDTYMNDTMPIIHYYEEKNLVKQVAASGTPEEVGNILNLFNIFPHLLL
jgi:UMP-CMP kinase